MKKYLLGLLLVALIIILAVPIVLSLKQTAPGSVVTNKILNYAPPAPASSRLAARAFGSLTSTIQTVSPTSLAGAAVATNPASPAYNLSSPTQPGAPQMMGASSINQSDVMTSPPALGQGGAGGGVAVSGHAIVVGPSPAFMYQAYRYVYHGGPITLSDDKLDVLERVKPGNSKNLSAWKLGNFDLLNFDTFLNAGVSNFQIVEDAKEGYIINVDVANGSISINQNWVRWAVPGPCNGKLCALQDSTSPASPTTPAVYPGDEHLIAAANAFMRDHLIDLSHYGAPSVISQGNIYPMMGLSAPTSAGAKVQSNTMMPIYYSPALTVLYPLEINGQLVYDQSGNPVGLTASVDVRTEKVTNVANLNTQNYQSSAYDAETDASKIIAVAEQGGVNGSSYQNGNVKIISIILGTPIRGFEKIFQNSNSGNASELYAPALIFPILTSSTTPPLSIIGTG